MTSVLPNLVHLVGMLLYHFQQIFLSFSHSQSILSNRPPSNDNGITHCRILLYDFIRFIVNQLIITIETKIELFHDSAVQIYNVDTTKAQLADII